VVHHCPPSYGCPHPLGADLFLIFIASISFFHNFKPILSPKPCHSGRRNKKRATEEDQQRGLFEFRLLPGWSVYEEHTNAENALSADSKRFIAVDSLVFSSMILSSRRSY
jgi:hypothetical protein